MPLIIPFLCRVVADHQSVLGQFLVEALGAGAVDEEVERLSNSAQREQWEERPHGCGVYVELLRRTGVCVSVVVEKRRPRLWLLYPSGVCCANAVYRCVLRNVGGDALWWMLHPFNCSTLESRDRNEKAWPWEAATFRKSSRGHPDCQGFCFHLHWVWPSLL